METYGVSEAFLAFDVPAGEHTVELRYTPQGLWAGILFSGISLCLVILLAILTHIRLQRKRDARLFARFDIPSPDSLRPPAAGGGNAPYAGPPSGAGPAFPDGNTPLDAGTAPGADSGSPDGGMWESPPPPTEPD